MIKAVSATFLCSKGLHTHEKICTTLMIQELNDTKSEGEVEADEKS